MNPSHRSWMISNTRPYASSGFGSSATFWIEEAALQAELAKLQEQSIKSMERYWWAKLLLAYRCSPECPPR